MWCNFRKSAIYPLNGGEKKKNEELLNNEESINPIRKSVSRQQSLLHVQSNISKSVMKSIKNFQNDWQRSSQISDFLLKSQTEEHSDKDKLFIFILKDNLEGLQEKLWKYRSEKKDKEHIMKRDCIGIRCLITLNLLSNRHPRFDCYSCGVLA